MRASYTRRARIGRAASDPIGGQLCGQQQQGQGQAIQGGGLFFDGPRSWARAETGFPKSQPGKGALNELKKVFQNRDRATVL